MNIIIYKDRFFFFFMYFYFVYFYFFVGLIRNIYIVLIAIFIILNLIKNKKRPNLS